MNQNDYQESRWVDGARLHPLSLHFADGDFERRFEQYRLRETQRTHRVWSSCAVGFCLLFGLLEYLVLPASYFAQAAMLRYGLVAPVLLFLFFYTRPVALRPLHNSTRVFGLMFAHAVNLYLFIITPYPANELYYLFALLTFVFTHGFTFLRFSYTSAVGWTALLCYMAAILWLVELPMNVAIMNAVILFFVTLTAFFSHYNSEVSLRRGFRSRAALRRQVRRSAALTRKAEESDTAKSNFLTMMSHELRTPLNAIIGFAEMIRQQMLGPIGNESYREYIGDIEASGRHLLRIIDDILDISQAQAGRLKLNDEEIDVADVAEAAIALSHRYEATGGPPVRVDIDPQLPKLRADGLKLRQILMNLVSNARKATPEDGRIRIAGVLDDSGGIRISIVDTGCGMPPDVAVAAAPFAERGDQMVRQQEGLGLGLPLVRALAALHNANVQIESTVGMGTTVTLAFPPARTIAASGPLRAVSSGG